MLKKDAFPVANQYWKHSLDLILSSPTDSKEKWHHCSFSSAFQCQLQASVLYTQSPEKVPPPLQLLSVTSERSTDNLVVEENKKLLLNINIYCVP